MEVKTNPFYELRNRLYASAAAGCSLMAEDFRLKRAIEAFQPMSEANKVFGKLYAMCNSLISSENKAADIIDCIALADALAVTQGTFSDDSETSPAEPNEYIKPARLTVNEIEEIKEKIRKTQYTQQVLDERFFSKITDPRLLSSFLEVAGKNGAGVVDMLISLESVYGEKIIPLLFDSLDLNEEKATGNQIRFISSVYHDKYNDKYIELAENENNPQGIRIAAIEAMAYSTENEERLITLYKISKGKVKNAALLSLAKMNSPAAEDPIRKMAEKPKKSNFEFLVASGGEAATEYARKELLYIMENGTKDKDPEHPFWLGFFRLLDNKKDVEDIFVKWVDKHSDKDFVPYSKEPDYPSLNEPLIWNLFTQSDSSFRELIRKLYSKYPIEFALSAFVLELNEAPETACKKICTDHRIYDRDIIYILRHLFSTPDGWYRLRHHSVYDKDDYKNIKLFTSIPDDILNFMTDPIVVYDQKDMKKLLKTGKECDIAAENMKQRCTLFQHLLSICPPSDKERVRDAAEKFAWNMIRNYPCDEAMRLLPLVTDRPMEGIAFRYAMMSMEKYSSITWIYYLRGFGLPEDAVANDMKKMKKYLEEHPEFNNEIRMKAVTELLRFYDVKE